MPPSGAHASPSDPLTLPCGAVLKNRLAKAAMSDSLGDGRGDVTPAQVRLYERWARGGVGLSIVGEVQGDARYPERPGNLVIGDGSDDAALRRLAEAGSATGCALWAQLGHAGALSDAGVGAGRGPSALDVDGLRCEALSSDEIDALPARYAEVAERLRALGFAGIEIHAAHGFLLSQFLSPLFNRRTDGYGGDLDARFRLVGEIVAAVRRAVGPGFPVGIKINASDQLEGGLTQDEALGIVSRLGSTSVDLIDISGGTYFPGAKASSDRSGGGPYFVDFARRARGLGAAPLMVTGGFKTRASVEDALATGHLDVVGLARPLVIDPELASRWLTPAHARTDDDPGFPRFDAPPPGGVTAWYTMRLTALANGAGESAQADNGTEYGTGIDLLAIVAAYEARDADRRIAWRARFGI